MEAKHKYVWLNTETGEFSNSWSEALHTQSFNDGEIQEITDKQEYKHWRLIKFECLNDPDFEFMNKMRLR